MLKRDFDLDELDFDIYSSQQFATVVFDRSEDAENVLITVIRNGMVIQFSGDNLYNPSLRRSSSCVYVKEECTESVLKICTIQHKGNTFLEARSVSKKEIDYLFNGDLEL